MRGALEDKVALYMEEIQTIFAVGAGAVTKLVKQGASSEGPEIKRIFRPKYPYEYLRQFATADEADKQNTKAQIIEFFS